MCGMCCPHSEDSDCLDLRLSFSKSDILQTIDEQTPNDLLLKRSNVRFLGVETRAYSSIFYFYSDVFRIKIHDLIARGLSKALDTHHLLINKY